MQLDIHHSINDIAESDWIQWFGDDYPFLSWRFLQALEQSGSTNADSGWVPCHMILRDGDDVVGAAPGFLKDHSYGEYVFDWAWADAWQRSGRQYYPKLVTAAPFTPATGPRLYVNPEQADSLRRLSGAIKQFCSEHRISGWHLLFLEDELDTDLSHLRFHQRQTVQFHWFNRGFKDFDDFLGTFSSRKRKNLRKERQRVEQQGLSLETRQGRDIQPEDWAFFHHCYQMTYAKRSGHGGYLSREFFTEGCPGLGDMPVMVVASDADGPVAAALYFRSNDTLYGRYWGCLKEYEFLHFEACYYQGIEYCIAQGLTHFDPGAQGEHKIQRGFEPILTYSRHWVAEAGFDEGIAAFCQQECEHVQAYRDEARTLLPFKSLTGGSVA